MIDLIAEGCRLFPVAGKQPLVKDWPALASCMPEQIEEWEKQFPGCNWGLATGPLSRVFVVDFDGEQGLASGKAWSEQHGDEWSNTRTAKTARGHHLFFRWPLGDFTIRNSARKIAPGVDVRAAGGYVVVPPSVHPSGVPYEWVNEMQPVDAPGWLLALLSKKAENNPPGNGSGKIPKGQRNSALASIAGSLRRRGLSFEAVYAALKLHNEKECDPPLSDEEVRAITESVCRYAPGEAPVSRFWTVQEEILGEVEPKVVPWLWEPYVPIGMLTMLTGDPGVGKSYVALAVCAPLTKQGHKIVYLTTENHKAYTLRPRFDVLSGDASKVVLIDGAVAEDRGGVITRPITLGDVEILRDSVERHLPRLIVVDPIQSYLGASVDSHRANETRPILDGLIKIAEEYELAVLLLRHASKAGGNRAIHRGLGSIDFTGAVRSELFAGETLDKTKAIAHIKSNIGPLGKAQGYEILSEHDGKHYSVGYFRWTGESDITCADMTEPEDQEKQGKTEEAQDFLYDLLKDGPVLTDDIKEAAEGAGIAWRTVQLAKQKLGFYAEKENPRDRKSRWQWPKLQREHSARAQHAKSCALENSSHINLTTTTTYDQGATAQERSVKESCAVACAVVGEAPNHLCYIHGLHPDWQLSPAGARQCQRCARDPQKEFFRGVM